MNLRLSLWTLLVVAPLWNVAALPSPPTEPAEGDTIVPVYQLQEAVIYGERSLNPTSMVTTLDRSEIRRHASLTVADLLRSDAGLEVTSGPKSETETRIRGFPARDVLVLVDGRPINPGYYGKVDLAMLPLDNIARVSVVKGPASVAYGPNGMGGVISVVTQNGLDKPHTSVEGMFGERDYRRLSLNHSGRARAVNYWLSLYEHRSAGFQLSRAFEPTSLEDGGVRRGSSYHRIGGDAKIGLQRSPAAQYALAAGYHWAEKDVPPTVYSWDSPTYRRFPFWARLYGSLSGSWQVAPPVELRAQVYGDAYHDRLQSYTGPEMSEVQREFDSRLENFTAGTWADARIEAGKRHGLHTGFSLKQDFVTKKSDIDQPWVLHRTTTAAGFLQDNFRLWRATEVTAGVSLNAFAADEGASLRGELCPMLSIRQPLHPSVTLRGSWASAIRFPTLHDLYSEDSGNSDLRPEEADKVELGCEATVRKVKVEVALFDSELRNLIYRSARTERFSNIGTARLEGFEAQADFPIFRGLAGGASYAYLNPAVSSDELMEETPPHRWRFQVLGETRFHTSIRYEFGYFAERTTYLPTRALSAYHIHSLSIQQRLTGQFTLLAVVRNLWDADYQEELGYPATGRFASAGIRWEN